MRRQEEGRTNANLPNATVKATNELGEDIDMGFYNDWALPRMLNLMMDMKAVREDTTSRSIPQRCNAWSR
jgi:hypothetical protein